MLYDLYIRDRCTVSTACGICLIVAQQTCHSKANYRLETKAHKRKLDWQSFDNPSEWIHIQQCQIPNGVIHSCDVLLIHFPVHYLTYKHAILK